MKDDEAAVSAVVDRFFAAFASGPGLDARMDDLRSLFVPGAVVVRTCDDLVVYDVASFIEPRRALLAGEDLTGFHEWPVEGRVDVYGDVAHWWGSYAKAGAQTGDRFEGRGAKSVQLVRTGDGWRITAVAWDDER